VALLTLLPWFVLLVLLVLVVEFIVLAVLLACLVELMGWLTLAAVIFGRRKKTAPESTARVSTIALPMMSPDRLLALRLTIIVKISPFHSLHVLRIQSILCIYVTGGVSVFYKSSG
jgi:hypothetical protein